MTILANPTEQLIADAVQYRLDSPALADALAGRVADDSHAAVLHDTLREDQTQLEELAALYGDRSIGATEWMAARKPIEARIATTKRQLAAATRSSAIDEWVGNADTLRGKWEGLNLTRQVAIVKAVLDHAVIGESPGNSAAFSIDRVTPAWRL